MKIIAQFIILATLVSCDPKDFKEVSIILPQKKTVEVSGSLHMAGQDFELGPLEREYRFDFPEKDFSQIDIKITLTKVTKEFDRIFGSKVNFSFSYNFKSQELSQNSLSLRDVPVSGLNCKNLIHLKVRRDGIVRVDFSQLFNLDQCEGSKNKLYFPKHVGKRTLVELSKEDLVIKDELTKIGSQIFEEFKIDHGDSIIGTEHATSIYLQSVLNELIKKTDQRKTDVKIVLINTPIAAIFSLPNDTILITKGMVENLEDESELINAMGKELAHLNLEHALVNVSKAINEVVILIDKLTEIHGEESVLCKEIEDSIDAELIKKLSKNGKLYFLNRNRENILQADMFGSQYSYVFGYEPWAIIKYLMNLDSIKDEVYFIESNFESVTLLDRMNYVMNFLHFFYPKLDEVYASTYEYSDAQKPLADLPDYTKFSGEVLIEQLGNSIIESVSEFLKIEVYKRVKRNYCLLHKE